jgi:MYXO-CTERM domain-containing protein
MGQIVFLPFIQPDAASALGSGPVYIGSFNVDIVANSAGIVDWTVAGGIGTFALELIDVNANPGQNPPGEVFSLADIDFGSARVEVVPAPSAMAVLGLGGLVAGRRRR